jgi:hypothetical protein
MKTAATLLLLGILMAGCDSREFAGPEEGPLTTPGATATFEVNYLVEGTYIGCEITYLDAARNVVSLPNAVELPWSQTFKVEVGPATGPFDANVSATCADPTKLGKSTVALLVGYGATATAVHTIGIP